LFKDFFSLKTRFNLDLTCKNSGPVPIRFSGSTFRLFSGKSVTRTPLGLFFRIGGDFTTENVPANRFFNDRDLICRQSTEPINPLIDPDIHGIDILLHEPALLAGLCSREVAVQFQDVRDKRDHPGDGFCPPSLLKSGT
jgi:hypothetical protein